MYTGLFEEPPAGEEELETRQCAAAVVSQSLESLLSHYSSFYRLKRAVCWLVKFANYLRKKDVQSVISVLDMESAENRLLKAVQSEAFASEIAAVRENKPVPASSSCRKFVTTLIDGLLCVGGRLKNSTTNANKHPIILPEHHITRLIIRDVHERNGHVGTNHTFTHLRRQFFLLCGYKQVRNVLKACVKCKKDHGLPMQQLMGDLPRERVEASQPPFTYVGVDYFGPFNVKYRRGTVKRYGCLFTCLVTRAVHIEIAHSLDSDGFIMALHRFMARRGKPSKIVSDNGTNFVGAEKELADEVKTINSKRLRDEMLMEAIDWQFIPPHAPHMGGVWERIVKSVKNVLRQLVGNRLLNDEELLTFMAEVEKILNDRPLTRMGSDARDEPPLTPSHLLLMRGNPCESQLDHEDNSIRRRWKIVQRIANAFYDRFVSEYLPTLQSRSKWSTVKDNIKVDDVVLVVEDDSARGQWPLGLVVKTEQSTDGLVRAAEVRFNGKTKRRPVTKLVLLERHCS